jgi:F0F1-type ATP synthase membrane subunit c/vacuolar-type H+-ATPase subunit K
MCAAAICDGLAICEDSWVVAEASCEIGNEVDGEEDAQIDEEIGGEIEGRVEGNIEGGIGGAIAGDIECEITEFALSDDSDVEDDEDACIAVGTGASAGSGMFGACIAIRWVAGSTVAAAALGKGVLGASGRAKFSPGVKFSPSGANSA